MKKETDLPHENYSIDEILAETKMKKETEADSGKPTVTPKVPSSDTIARDAMNALKMETAGEPKFSAEKEEAHAEKKKKHSFFHRKKVREEDDDDDSIPEDDIYYGLQLKSLEEYKREYDQTISIDTKTVNDAEESLRRKRRAINEAVWGNEDGPAKDKEPSVEVEQAKTEQTVPPEPAAKQEPEQKPKPEKAPDHSRIVEPEQPKPEKTVRWKPAAKQEPEQKPEPEKAPDLDRIVEPEQPKPEKTVRWEPAAKQEPEQKPEPEKAPDLDRIAEPEQPKPESPLKTETAAPEGVSPKSHAVPVKKHRRVTAQSGLRGFSATPDSTKKPYWVPRTLPQAPNSRRSGRSRPCTLLRLLCFPPFNRVRRLSRSRSRPLKNLPFRSLLFSRTRLRPARGQSC